MKKTINSRILSVILCVAFLGLWSCSKDSPAPPVVAKTLTIDTNKIDFVNTGNSASVIITTTVDAWAISSSDSSWIQISQVSGYAGTTSVGFTALANTTTATRTATITISSSQAASIQISVSQVGVTPAVSLYPNYNTNPIAADATGMSSTAVQLAAKFKLGWNIGNTMEATGGETGWGNPLITENYVKFVKQNGFTAIRIPCDWNQYANATTAQIQTVWLNRVKQVVQYCVNNDMYVLLNIHWDGGWLENNVTEAQKEANNAKQKAFWEQIATTMRDFDEHLMFASANEPNVENATQMAVLTSYHQTFIDAVRSTGGKNAYRTLVIQGPSTDITKTNQLMTTLPTDTATNRMMAEVHFYTPYQFCIMNADASWGKIFYYWGAGHHSTIEPDRNATWGEEAEVDKEFLSMKTQFVDKGIPVILGEYGAYRRTTPKDLATHNDAVDYWITYVTKQALANGIKPFWWDTSGALDRNSNIVKDQRTIDAIIAGGN